MAKARCVCGCGRRAVHRHHVVYAQELVRRADTVADGHRLLRDPRNLVDVANDCHGQHHARRRPLPLHVLSESVFEFAGEVLGPAAYGYLSRRYSGGDPRHDALLNIAA